MAAQILSLEEGRRNRRGETSRLGSRPRLRLVADNALYTAQVRGVQNLHPLAHAQMLQWAEWSRKISILPRISRPSIWNEVNRRVWGDEYDDLTGFIGPANEDGEIAEAGVDDKEAEALDILIHSADFPAIWRVIARKLYFESHLEYQAPRACQMKDADFVRILENMLGWLGER